MSNYYSDVAEDIIDIVLRQYDFEDFIKEKTTPEKIEKYWTAYKDEDYGYEGDFLTEIYGLFLDWDAYYGIIAEAINEACECVSYGDIANCVKDDWWGFTAGIEKAYDIGTDFCKDGARAMLVFHYYAIEEEVINKLEDHIRKEVLDYFEKHLDEHKGEGEE